MKLIYFFSRLALIASALFFGGCIKDSGTAYEAPGDLSIAKTSLVDSFTPYLETFRFDSLVTSGREYLLVGNYTESNSVAGIKAEGYFQFLPETYPLVYPENLEEDYTKATITLQNDYVYGTTGTDQFGLYKLTSDLRGDKTFFSNESAGFEPNPMFTTVNAYRTDNRITIDANALGKEIVKKWKELGSFTSDQQFLDTWKGFALRSLNTDPQQARITRFDLKYAASPNDATVPPSFLQLTYYVNVQGQPEAKKILFRTNTSTVQYYNVKPTFTGTPYAVLQNATGKNKSGISSVLTNNQAITQGLAGLAIKVKLPGLLEWKKKQTQQIKIFKAELEIVPNDPGSQAVPEYLSISNREDYFQPNESDKSSVVYDDETILSYLNQPNFTRETAKNQNATRFFLYNSTSNVYKCNITGHIQDIMDGKSTSSSLNIYNAEWPTKANRLILSNGSVKLKVYYFPI